MSGTYYILQIMIVIIYYNYLGATDKAPGLCISVSPSVHDGWWQ